jgi:hypothetical protein
VKLWAIFVSLVLAAAQTTPAPSKSVIGEVTAIDASAKQIKIKADDGAAYAIALADSTSYLRVPPGEKDLKKATKIAFTDVAVGDRLLARGPLTDETKTVAAKTIVVMTKADLAQKHERDRAEWQKRGIAGIVTALNADAKEITISTHGRDAKPVVIEASSSAFRRYASDSVRFDDAKPSSFADLQVGDTVHGLGEKSEDGTRFKAEELLAGGFQTIAATVVSVNAATGELVVTDLKTKKPVTIQTNQNSMLRKLEERTATFLARRMRPDAAAGGGPVGAGGAAGVRPAEAQSAAPAAPGAPASSAAGGAGGPYPGAGGPRGPGGGSFDLQQLLERSPQLSLADLKKGDALIISSSKGANGSSITAFSLVAGVEPFLAAAPRTAGQVDLGSWSLSVGAPEQ